MGVVAVRDAIGNAWDWLNVGYHVVVPTNIGYRSDFRAVMDTTFSATVTARFKDSDLWYGMYCYSTAPNSCVVKHIKFPVIFFPTKPFNADKPWLSWDQPESPALIEKSIIELAKLDVKNVAIPLVDGLVSAVKTFRRHLVDDRFVLVRAAMKKAA